MTAYSKYRLNAGNSSLLGLSFAVLALLVTTCSWPKPNDNQPDDSILWGQSIAGILIGDDSTSVFDLLGHPDSVEVTGYNGFLYHYTSGPLAGLAIALLDDSTLGYGIFSVAVQAPYAGTTEEGFGIGTSRDDILVAYGEPEKKHGSTWSYTFGNIEQKKVSTEFYAFNEIEFFLVYDEAEEVSELHMTGLLKVFEERIIWGQSIEGIRIGDDADTVIAMLGPPDMIGHVDGDGYVLIYTSGPHATMDVYISTAAYLPGVMSVNIFRPNPGTSREGIGIDVQRDLILAYLGKPEHRWEISTAYIDSYVFEEISFDFIITSDSSLHVYQIGMGLPPVDPDTGIANFWDSIPSPYTSKIFSW